MSFLKIFASINIFAKVMKKYTWNIDEFELDQRIFW